MSFSSIVKSTGNFFSASIIVDPPEMRGRDAHEILSGHTYMGLHFQGTQQVVESGNTIYFAHEGKVEVDTFKAEDLLPVIHDHIRLIKKPVNP